MERMPPEVDAAVQAYVAAVRQLFAGNLIGIYVHGSLAYDAFDAAVSDVDLIVVHRADLTDAQRRALPGLHARLLTAHPAAARLDGTYVPLRAVRADGVDGADAGPAFRDGRSLRQGVDAGPAFRDGRVLRQAGGDLNTVTRETLRGRGRVLHGPPPADVIPAVSSEALRETMWRNIAFLRRRMPVYVLGGTAPTVFGVLTLCRVWYTLRTGEIVSKRAAGLWAVRRVPARWRPLLRRALTRYGRPRGVDLVLAVGALPFAAYISRAARHRNAAAP